MRRSARLARLDPAPEREARLALDFARILAAFESLQEVDVAGVLPLHQPLLGSGEERPDEDAADRADGPLDRDALLARAPRAREGCFSVPKTVGG